MDNIDKLFTFGLITDEAREIEQYVNDKWGRHFYTELEQPLKELFPVPENKGLLHIWKHGSADVLIYRQDTKKLVAIIEPGGGQHLQDEKQMLNDRRKYMLCKINGVKCLQVINGVMKQLSKRRWRKLLGSYLFIK
jgi:hypothetical protein